MQDKLKIAHLDCENRLLKKDFKFESKESLTVRCQAYEASDISNYDLSSDIFYRICNLGYSKFDLNLIQIKKNSIINNLKDEIKVLKKDKNKPSEDCEKYIIGDEVILQHEL